MTRIILPAHLRTLARTQEEVTLDLTGEVTLTAVLDALEARFPVLTGTIRDHTTRQRREMIRFFACEEDWSNEPHDIPLPAQVASGEEPLYIIGAIAGG